MLSTILTRTAKWRCVYLLVAIVSLLALYPYPYLLGRAWANYLFDLLVVAVMLLGLYSVSHKRRWAFGLMALMVPATLGDVSRFEGTTQLIVLVLHAVFFFVMAGVVLQYVFSNRGHIADRLCGALSVYFLAGIAFANVYEVVFRIDPDALQFAQPLADPARLTARLLYLSFVTQTTLGYGDITPRTMVAESITLLQASTGVLYVAVLVSWLVGSMRPANPSNDPD